MQLLYHASPHKSLKVLSPRRTLSNNKFIGDFLFATENEALAAMYLATKGVQTLMETEAATPFIVIYDHKENYSAHDRGGAIYTLPANTFVQSPQAGLEAYELVSPVAVKPVSKRVFASSIAAMKKYGIRVYFVEPEFALPKGMAALQATLETLPPNQKA